MKSFYKIISINLITKKRLHTKSILGKRQISRFVRPAYNVDKQPFSKDMHIFTHIISHF